jgi:hypothetical protein
MKNGAPNGAPFFILQSCRHYYSPTPACKNISSSDNFLYKIHTAFKICNPSQSEGMTYTSKR